MDKNLSKQVPKRGSKLKAVLQSWLPGTIGVQSWLDEQGISRQLVKKFVDGGWVKRIGVGAYSLVNDDPTWLGGLYTLQRMKQYKIHVAGISALDLLGYSQYLTFSDSKFKLILLHPSEHRAIPVWFKQYFKKNNVHFVKSSIFTGTWDLGLMRYKQGMLDVKVATPERAILEAILLSKTKADYVHLLELLENLVTLRPVLLQQLLEHCKSHKVIRLFLAMAEVINHPWFSRIDINKLQLGKGKYVLSDGGYYNSKYQISTPIDLRKGADNG